MEDPNLRKVPPDRPSDELVCVQNRKKKTKLNTPSSLEEGMVIEDSAVETTGDDTASPMEHEDTPSRRQSKVGGPPASYKESLLGFNGVDNHSGFPAEDELLSDVFTKEWELPEPTEEIKELMKEYPVIPIEPEEYSEWCRPWNTALIITVLGRKYNVYTLKYHLGRMWGFADFELIDLPNNYFIVRFAERDGWIERYKKVLYGGPWVVQQQCLAVQQWSANFNPFSNLPRKVISWVRIPNIPLECYTKRFITRLGNRIGKTLRVDMHTLSESCNDGHKVERGRYARICVELDLQKKLISRVIAANSVYNVEYEGLNVICFSCGRYGHRKEVCPNVAGGRPQYTGEASMEGETQTQRPPTAMPAKPSPIPEEKFGTWMLVGNTQKARFSKKDPPKSKKGEQGRNSNNVRQGPAVGPSSRFDILRDLEGEEIKDNGQEYPSNMAVIPVTQRSQEKRLVIYQEKNKPHGSDRTSGKEGKARGKPSESRDIEGKENVHQLGQSKYVKAQNTEGETRGRNDSVKPRGGPSKDKKQAQRNNIIVSGRLADLPTPSHVDLSHQRPQETETEPSEMEGVLVEGDQREIEASNGCTMQGNGVTNPLVVREFKSTADQHQSLVCYVKKPVEDAEALIQ